MVVKLLLKGIVGGLAEKSYKVVAFDMRDEGKSTRRASLIGFVEIKDVIAVCKWGLLEFVFYRILIDLFLYNHTFCLSNNHHRNLNHFINNAILH